MIKVYFEDDIYFILKSTLRRFKNFKVRLCSLFKNVMKYFYYKNVLPTCGGYFILKYILYSDINSVRLGYAGYLKISPNISIKQNLLPICGSYFILKSTLRRFKNC